MEKDLEKRFMTKDGKHRISIYREECAENPRYISDEPLHCEDWDRDHTIMTENERPNRSDGARGLLEYMVREYGDHNAIMSVLFENGKHMRNGKCNGSDALAYERSSKRWVHYVRSVHYNYETNKYEADWHERESFDCKKEELYVDDVLDTCEDDTINYFIEKCMTDGVKLGSYSFGYYGSITFSDGADTDSEGICWLEKDEFLKYSGCSEDFWKSNTLKDIEWLWEEIEAWGDNDVYGFVTESAVKTIVNTHYPDGEREDSTREIIEWEEKDSCWGFYGELDKIEDDILNEAGYKLDELVED